jgi:hypothetical protein
MLKGTKGTMLIAVVLILMFVSPMVFAKWMVSLDDEGLKSLHVRADIYEDTGSGAEGQKHGRVQVLLTEIEPKLYSYKFQIHLRKATPSTEYEIHVWTYLPDITFSIYGDTKNFLWKIIEGAVAGIDQDPTAGVIMVNLASLGLTGEHEAYSGMSFVTDERGSYKEIKSGVKTETEIMEYVLDLSWPIFKAELGLGGLSDNVDFADFGITGVYIHPSGKHGYQISGSLSFESDVDAYCTEDITYTYYTDGFLWEA